ncbi:hypothetical protein [Methylophaga nitratireducenticrescens]|uniref:Uncharacterized protein n=1 Tax=Methylophaga nitratireducenticrescens TaxID=754476 RepID=I1XG07_METNJ|nr:hypothetical protein [Methylophaga nitratireducenticrescens]AFI83326.1 hypothetical protein Q7A_477 [Methylophaga nitratireducenticrescens]AUZ83446.1 hypothetical protein CDW43_02145 [Methylophaga nitratireducenticrescens]
MRPKSLLKLEWDAIAGIIAAIVAIVLHFLHIAQADLLLPILLALIGLLFINFLRHSKNNEITAETIEKIHKQIDLVQNSLKESDIELIGPRKLRSENDRFLKEISGDVVFYNICLKMYSAEAMFNGLLRPVFDNPGVSSVCFILDVGQQANWERTITSRLSGHPRRGILREPKWCSLAASLSFIMAEQSESKCVEALLSFWGEPFMTNQTGIDTPRYIFRLKKHNELLPHLESLIQNQRLQSN